MAAKVFQDGFYSGVGAVEARFVPHDHLVVLLYGAGEKFGRPAPWSASIDLRSSLMDSFISKVSS